MSSFVKAGFVLCAIMQLPGCVSVGAIASGYDYVTAPARADKAAAQRVIQDETRAR
jgi:hypothetical protein